MVGMLLLLKRFAGLAAGPITCSKLLSPHMPCPADCRPRLAGASWRAKRSRRTAKTCWPSATAATCLGEQAQWRAVRLLSVHEAPNTAAVCVGSVFRPPQPRCPSAHAICRTCKLLYTQSQRNNCLGPVDIATSHAWFALPPALPSPRKRKLLEKQKEGKKRMRRLGSVDVPQEVFHELMKAGSGK